MGVVLSPGWLCSFEHRSEGGGFNAEWVALVAVFSIAVKVWGLIK